jgi:hypothetical protein
MCGQINIINIQDPEFQSPEAVVNPFKTRRDAEEAFEYSCYRVS